MIKCKVCDNAGLIAAVSKENGFIYAFRCNHCQIADRRGISPKIPKWRLAYSKDYKVDKTELVNMSYQDNRNIYK